MPHKVTFSFEYEYSSSQGSGKATFDFNMDMLRMRVRNNKETQTQDVNITADYTENDFSIYDISDKTYAEKIKVALYKGFENNGFVNDKILPKINLIDAYKKKLSQKADFKFSSVNNCSLGKVTLINSSYSIYPFPSKSIDSITLFS